MNFKHWLQGKFRADPPVEALVRAARNDPRLAKAKSKHGEWLDYLSEPDVPANLVDTYLNERVRWRTLRDEGRALMRGDE